MIVMKLRAERWIVPYAVACWGLAVLAALAVLAIPSFVGDTGCELVPGGSFFGRAGRSWLPPGTTCTYDVPGVGRYVDGPSPFTLAPFAVAILGLPVLRHLARRRRA